MSATTQTLRIGLLWHALQAGNLGVGALTVANIAIIRAVARELGIEPVFTVLTMRESGTSSIAPDVRQYVIDGKTMFSPRGFAREVATFDCVIDIGAGDSFADIYGPKRYLYLWLSKLLTLWRKVPLILAPQTIGPFTKPVYRQSAAHVLRRASAVVARDPASFQALKELAPDANAGLATDVAFLLPYTDNSALRGQAPIRVGVNASGLLCSQAESGANRYGLSYDYLKLQRRLIEYWLERGDAQVHLVAHATSGQIAHDDDGRHADLLAREYPAAIRVPDFAGPIEAKSYISGLDFLVAGRMHACIAAYSSHVPVVPLAYSRKFDGLFSQLDYPCIAPVRGLDDDGALAFVIDAFERRAELQAAEAAGMARVDALMDSYRDMLRTQFRALAGGGR